jgi:signal transduction protein with GAF and PtsI domain
LSRLALDELLDAIVDAIPDMLPAAEAASLWLHDAERDELVARAWAGHDDEAISGLALPPDTSLVGLVCRSRQPQDDFVAKGSISTDLPPAIRRVAQAARGMKHSES